MNIRSPCYYQFLRNHNIIPLPCTRTIWQYYSIIDTKCGFDENFVKLLVNIYQRKIRCNVMAFFYWMRQFKGFNLRRPHRFRGRRTKISRYQRSGDSRIDYHVSTISRYLHTANCCVCLEKSCKRRWACEIGDQSHNLYGTLLGVKSTLHCIKTWFTHPNDDKRRVFVFSDVPHVVKCICNQLY